MLLCGSGGCKLRSCSCSLILSVPYFSQITFKPKDYKSVEWAVQTYIDEQSLNPERTVESSRDQTLLFASQALLPTVM